jgi:hypothetical protein
MRDNEMQKLENRVDQLKAVGLVDLKFFIAEVSESTPEDFAREVNEFFNAIENGSTIEPLVFNDGGKRAA